jgi:hypothetical protein
MESSAAGPSNYLPEHDEGQSQSGGHLDQKVDDLIVSILHDFESLLAHSSFGSEPTPKEQRSFKRLQEEYHRIRSWNQELKAELLSGPQTSLDLYLRTDQALWENASGLLHRISANVNRAANQIVLDPETASSASGDDSSSSYSSRSTTSEYNHSKPHPPGERKARRFALVVSHIHDSVRVLYNLGSLLRHPGYASKQASIQSFEDINEDYYEQSLLRARLKVLQWRKHIAGKNIDDSSADWSTVTDPDLYTLCKRLALADARRQRFLEERSKSQPPPTLKRKQDVATERVTRRDSQFMAPDNTYSESHLRIHSKSNPPTTSAVSVAQKETESPLRPIIGVTYGEQLAFSVPAMPAAGLNSEPFDCPYCGRQLEINSTVSWEHHVYRDLRPYVCTFPSCAKAEFMYSSRHDWIYHEMQMHRRRWVCCDCSLSFSHQGLIIQHLETKHNGSWDQRQLPTLLQMSERPLAENEPTQCPLCHSTLDLESLLGHLAQHMEEISLLCLQPHPSSRPMVEPIDDKEHTQSVDRPKKEKMLGSTARDLELPWKGNFSSPQLSPLAEEIDPHQHFLVTRQTIDRVRRARNTIKRYSETSHRNEYKK